MESKQKFTLRDGHQVAEVRLPGDDTTYYEFVDCNTAPCNRVFTAKQYFNELQQRCDRDYLIAHCQAVIDCLNGRNDKNKGVVDIVQISNLTTQLKERVEWIMEPESVLKYASVVLFDENENPYDYDAKYNNEVKIKRWKENKLSSFFLSEPVKRLLPLLNLSEEDLDTWLDTQKEIEKRHLQDIITTLSKERQTASLSTSLESLRQREAALRK